MSAIGLPHSIERKAQVDRIFDQADNFQRRGVTVKTPEIPRGVETRTAQHDFLKSRPQGVGLVAAGISSAPFAERMTPEGLERRRQAVSEAGARRCHQWITAIMTLAQIKFDKRTYYYYYARCEECSTEFVSQDKRPHKCLANKNKDKESITIVRHFLYPTTCSHMQARRRRRM